MVDACLLSWFSLIFSAGFCLLEMLAAATTL
uniref:Uncharacterized protein n=1 Tax=Arundo donax TaxID=35708 RepID=A0A0A9BUN8_ARUDO